MLGGLFACTPKSAAPLEAAAPAAVGNPGAATPQDAVASTPEITCQVDGLGTLEVGNLLIYDPNIQLGTMEITAAMEGLAASAFGGADILTATSFTELVAIIKSFCRIRELTLFFHGIPGHCIMTGDPTPKSLFDIAGMFNGVAPEVDFVRIDGCNVGRNAQQLLNFLNLFDASRVEAWNMYHFLSIRQFKLTADDAPETINSHFPPMEFLLPDAPEPASFAGIPGAYTSCFEWFYPVKDDFSIHPSDEDFLKLHTRASAADLPINKKSAAEDEQYRNISNAQLRRVIVTS